MGESLLAAARSGAYVDTMTAVEIIEELKRLPTGERERVVEFLLEEHAHGQLSGRRLGELAEQLIESGDPVQRKALKERITKGFYGE